MRTLALLLTCSSVWAQSAPPNAEAALHWLSAHAGKRGLQVLRDPAHLIWGKDAKEDRWEALALLCPRNGTGTERLVRLFWSRRGTWAAQRVLEHQCSKEDRGAIMASSAGQLAEAWCPPLAPGQREDLPSLPVEFHFHEGPEEGSFDLAMVFHPRLGLAEVASSLVDDLKDPASPGQVWGTHARGESVDLPLSAVNKRAKKLDHWGGRVWFRLDGQLYAICEGDWRGPEVQGARN